MNHSRSLREETQLVNGLPKETILEPRFEFLSCGCLDIEHRKGTRNVEEKDSVSEIFPRTTPVRGKFK